MPTLKQIECSVELGHGNAPLPEYRVRYGDGRVKCRLATPEEDDMPFSIRVIAKGYIAPGLACHVFIDGELHCTRNAPSSTEHQPDHSQSTIEFRFRQHESPHGDNTYIGREWSFTKLRRAKDTIFDDKRFDTRVGTIEIIVLRCRYDDIDFNAVPRMRGKRGNEEKAPQKPPAQPVKNKAAKQKGNNQEAKVEQAKAPNAANTNGKGPAQSTPTIAASAGRGKSDISMSSVSLGFDGTVDHEPMICAVDFDQSEISAEQKGAPHLPPYGIAVPIAWLDGPSETASSISIRTIAQDQAKENEASSVISSYSYWKVQCEAQSAAHRGPRPVLIFPALPLPLVSTDCKPGTDRAVQIGAGALYTHETRRPLYIDDESLPYAVFRFEYCSPQALTKLTGLAVGAEYYDAIARATKSQLEGMPKSELVEELLQRRGRDGIYVAEAQHDQSPIAAAAENELAACPAKEVQPVANSIHSQADQPTPTWNMKVESQKEASVKPGSKTSGKGFTHQVHKDIGPGGNIW